MMLGNPRWFKRRQYTGWGITPCCWQGWVYIACVFGSIIAMCALCNWLDLQLKQRVIIIAILFALIIADALSIAMKIKSDEREKQHEAIAERNASWYMSFVLTVGILYQAILSALHGNLAIDPFIITAILGGTIVKAVTHWYLIDK